MNEKPQILDQFGNPISSSQLEKTEKTVEQTPEPVEQKPENVQTPEKIQEQIAVEHEKLDKNMQQAKEQVEKMGGWNRVYDMMNHHDSMMESGKNFMKISGGFALFMAMMVASADIATPGFVSSIAEGTSQLLSGTVNTGSVLGGSMATLGAAATGLLGYMGTSSTVQTIKGFFEKRKLKKLKASALGLKQSNVVVDAMDELL